MEKEMRDRILNQLQLKPKKLSTGDEIKNRSSLYGDGRSVWGDAKDVWGDVTDIVGDITGVTGDVSRFVGCMSGIRGDASEIIALLEKTGKVIKKRAV